ncbi:AHH domain-containing protein [Streptomyces canus]|uniref:AHH domain-containing protein n=1 Tax=Streptomyces canus TaxID=58343 RepID=UPI002E26A1BF
MSPGGDSLSIRLHLPESVTLDGEPAQDRQRALEQVLLRAVSKAVAGLRETGLRANGMPQPAGAAPFTPLATAVAVEGAVQAEAAAGPSAGGGFHLAFALSADAVGNLTDQAAGTGQSAPTTAEPAAPPAAPAPAPASPPPAASAPQTAPPPADAPEPPPGGQDKTPTAAKADDVVEGPSALDGHVVMLLLGGRTVTLGGATRYVRASNLTRAIQLGLNVFGTTSFALLEGPLGAQGSGLWAVATTPTVSDQALKRGAERWSAAGVLEMTTVEGGEVKGSIVDEDGHRYAVLSVVSKEKHHLVPNAEAGREIIARMKHGGRELPAAETHRLVFGDLDQLVDQVLGGDESRLQAVADRLAQFDMVAFWTVPMTTKARYLQVLIRAWTLDEHERAIVEIMRSLKSVAELDYVRGELARAGIAEQLFRDIGDNLWDLLVTVGSRFGRHTDFTVRGVANLVAEAFDLSPEAREEIRRNVLTGGAVQLSLWVLTEIETLAVAAVNLLMGFIEGLAMIVTRPAQIIEGLGQLVHLVLTFYLAGEGYKPAEAECAVLVKHIGRQLGDGLEGAALLHVGERVLARIKWAVVLEVASWFVGIGELKAVASAVGLTEKLASVLRFLALIGKAAEGVEGSRIAAGLPRVARAMRIGSAVLSDLRTDEDVLRLLSHLPVEDQRRLGEVLEHVDVAENSTLADLLAHEQLKVVEGPLRKAEILQTLAAKSGGLSEELAYAFRRLAGPGGFSEQELGRLAKALKPGEGKLFLAALEQIGLARIGPGAEVGMDFLTVLAADTRRMDAVRSVGYQVVQVAFDVAGGETAAFDAILLEIALWQQEARRTDRAAAFSTMLERLERADPEAWRLVAGAHAAAGPAVEHAAVLGRIRSIRARYRGRAVHREAMLRQLEALRRLSKKNPRLAMDIIEEFEARRLDRVGTFADDADLAQAFDDASKWATHDEQVLLHEAGEAPPEALAPSDTPDKPWGADRPTAAMARNMPEPPPPGHDLHHIVPEGDPRAEIARRILEDAEIDVRQGPENGIYLPRTSTDPRIVAEAATRHPTLHTNAYYKELTLRLIEARRSNTVHETLAVLKEELKNGQFFHLEDGATKGERFADWLMREGGDLEWLESDELLEIVEATRRRPRPRIAPAAPAAAPRPTAPGGPRIAPDPPAPEPPPAPPSGELLDDPVESADARRLRLPGNKPER